MGKTSTSSCTRQTSAVMKFLICLTLVLACVVQTSAILDIILSLFDEVKMPGKEVKLLGCFVDNLDGCFIPGIFGGCAVPHPGRVFQGGVKEYPTETVVKRCLEDAIKNGVDTFAIQDLRFCYANDKNAAKHYNKYGPRIILPFCAWGKGGILSNDVYQIVKKEPKRDDIVTQPPPAPLPKCTFTPGDGSGGSEVKVGSQAKGKDCLRLCMEEKKEDDRINGVTYSRAGNNNKGCWCEVQMTGINKSQTKKNKYKTCFINDVVPPTPPAPEPASFNYGSWKNKNCPATYTSQGCHAENPSFDRKDAKLLVYWRHDIEWARARRGAFGQSLVCACAAAAEKAGMPFFAIHFWGECWGVNIRDLSPIGGGDCVRANFARGMCMSGGQTVCLADKHFMVYGNFRKSHAPVQQQQQFAHPPPRIVA